MSCGIYVVFFFNFFISPSTSQAASKGLSTGNAKWVSRWASLADGYSDSGPISGQIDISTQMDLSGSSKTSLFLLVFTSAHFIQSNDFNLLICFCSGVGQIIPQSMHNRTNDSTGADDGQIYRARRILPQLPTRGEGQVPPPSIHVQPETYVERNIQGSLQKDHQKLYVSADLDPDSLSDASKSDDGSIIELGRKTSTGKAERICTEDKADTSSKQDVMADKMVKDQDCTAKFSTATLTRQQGSSRKSGDSSVSPPGKDASTCKENAASLMRQESFTKHRASDDIHFMKLPNISSPESSNDTNAFKGVCNQDTQSYLKETENSLAVLEAKLQAQKHNRAPCAQEESLSGESDVDTSSTVSQRSSKNSGTSAPKKPLIVSELLKGKKSASQRAKEQNLSGNLQSRKCRDISADSNYKESGKTSQRSTMHHWSDAVSDQESGTQPVHRKYTIPLQNESSRRTLKGTVTQALARIGSFSAPKPTRTSMLRRARLGDASDNDGTETDRTSQNSDANSSSAKTQESKKLSRLDILALPRRRTSSFTTPSDTESSAVRTGFSNRSEADSGFSARKASVPDIKTGTQKGSGTTGRQPIIRGRSSSAKYTSSTASEYDLTILSNCIYISIKTKCFHTLHMYSFIYFHLSFLGSFLFGKGTGNTSF